MTTTLSDKITGYTMFSVNGITFHACNECSESNLFSYWNALDLEREYLKYGLRLPVINEAHELLKSGLLESSNLPKPIAGNDIWLLCWVKDYAAIVCNPDSNEYSLYENASGLGQVAPVWFVTSN